MSGAVRVAFALGANLGDRVGALRGAVRALATTPGLSVVAVSPVYETDPVGGPPGQSAFLNAVLVADSASSPADLLARAHAIEQEHGRVRAERWGPRTLDIDLLAVGARTAATEELTLPHPRAHLRAFVLIPWADVDPAFEVPGLGRVADLLAALPAADRDGVRPADESVTGAGEVRA
jgi:2-amino-4-hydroxy-6-hydroxymethyldihydropteridine diphosphokinase